MRDALILGAKGRLGSQLSKVFNNPILWDREDIDIRQTDVLRNKLINLEELPPVIINCVAYNDVDAAEDHPDLAYEINGKFVGELAKICKELDLTLVHFSSNYVFDGQKGEYLEEDEPNPISVYGQSKHQGEQLLIGCFSL